MSLIFFEVNAPSACDSSNNKMFMRQHKTTSGYELVLRKPCYYKAFGTLPFVKKYRFVAVDTLS